MATQTFTFEGNCYNVSVVAAIYLEYGRSVVILLHNVRGPESLVKHEYDTSTAPTKLAQAVALYKAAKGDT